MKLFTADILIRPRPKPETSPNTADDETLYRADTYMWLDQGEWVTGR